LPTPYLRTVQVSDFRQMWRIITAITIKPESSMLYLGMLHCPLNQDGVGVNPSLTLFCLFRTKTIPIVLFNIFNRASTPYHIKERRGENWILTKIWS
jgi:hypothetical protein